MRTERENREFRRLYREGWRLEDMAEHFDCSVHQVKGWRDRLGLPLRHKHKRRPLPNPGDDYMELQMARMLSQADRQFSEAIGNRRFD